jgi:hypothetical protein
MARDVDIGVPASPLAASAQDASGGGEKKKEESGMDVEFTNKDGTPPEQP